MMFLCKLCCVAKIFFQAAKIHVLFDPHKYSSKQYRQSSKLVTRPHFDSVRVHSFHTKFQFQITQRMFLDTKETNLKILFEFPVLETC